MTSIRRRLVAGAFTLTTAQLVQQFAHFAANVVVVRALTKADYGIAATFGLCASMIEMMAALGMENLVVQSGQGEDPRFQRTLQLVRFAQGCLLALALYAIAPLLSFVFNAQEYTWAYQLLAISPLALGAVHFDRYRFQREFRYLPSALCDLGAEVVALAAVVLLSSHVVDPSLVLALFLGRPVLRVLLSHLVAERGYRWAWARDHVREIFRFGWPVLLNGLVLFVAFQGDRLLIGSAETLHAWLGDLGAESPYSKEDLAEYSVAFSLALVASLMANRILVPLALPALSQVQGDDSRFGARLLYAVDLFAAVGAALTALFALGAGALVVLIYTDRYAGAEAFIAWIGLAQGLRLLRMAAASAATALGDTKIALFGNLARGAGFAAAAAATVVSLPLVWIARAAVGGELCALAMVSLALLRRHRLSPVPFVRAAALLLGCFGACLALRPWVADFGLMARSGVGLAAAALAVGLAAACSSSLRREAPAILRALGRRG